VGKVTREDQRMRNISVIIAIGTCVLSPLAKVISEAASAW
jgi:hypothetical protein